MTKQDPARKPYRSDLTDEQWGILEPLLPPPRTQHGGRPRRVNLREVLNTLLYQNRTKGYTPARVPSDARANLAWTLAERTRDPDVSQSDD